MNKMEIFVIIYFKIIDQNISLFHLADRHYFYVATSIFNGL